MNVHDYDCIKEIRSWAIVIRFKVEPQSRQPHILKSSLGGISCDFMANNRVLTVDRVAQSV